LDPHSIGYAAYLSNIEQEVAPVTSGHRVTLTYKLYFNDDDGTKKRAVSKKLLIPPKPPNQDWFCEAFKTLLENPEFMAEGGTLAFGLRHSYPFKYDLKPIYDVLKGSDAVVYQTLRVLGFEPKLYMYYNDEDVIIDKVVDFGNLGFDLSEYEEGVQPVSEFMQAEGGTLVRQVGKNVYNDDLDDYLDPEPLEWVTPRTTFNRKEGQNKLASVFMDGDACMIVRIGKAGDRLVYPTAAQIKKAYRSI